MYPCIISEPSSNFRKKTLCYSMWQWNSPWEVPWSFLYPLVRWILEIPGEDYYLARFGNLDEVSLLAAARLTCLTEASNWVIDDSLQGIPSFPRVLLPWSCGWQWVLVLDPMRGHGNDLSFHMIQQVWAVHWWDPTCKKQKFHASSQTLQHQVYLAYWSSNTLNKLLIYIQNKPVGVRYCVSPLYSL